MSSRKDAYRQALKDAPDYHPNLSQQRVHVRTRYFKGYSDRTNMLFKTATIWSDKYFPEKKYIGKRKS